MKWFPWIALAVVIIILALRGCEGPADHSTLQHRYDSATLSGAKLATRLNVRESELATLRATSRTLQKASNEESISLQKELAEARRHPKVVEVVRTVPAVADAFNADDRMMFFQTNRIRYLIMNDSIYKSKDSLFHVGQDSLINNMEFRARALNQNVTDLTKDLKKQSNPFSIGIGVGPGVVIGPDGQVHGGLAVTVGVNLKIRRRR